MGLNENQIMLIERFPPDPEAFVAAALSHLAGAGAIDSVSYSSRGYESHASSVAARFEHSGNVTYIFPEEQRLLYALADIARPRRVAFVGAYYGYWAVWALPALALENGHAVLLDKDEITSALARVNIDRLSLSHMADVVCADAAAYMSASRSEFDWIVLDVEGPKYGAPYDQTDKALYHPMLTAALPRLRDGGLLICHNMLLSHEGDNPYFANMVRNNQRQFYKFLPLVAERFSVSVHVASTEGIGVYRV